MPTLFDSPVATSLDLEHICDFEIELDPAQTIASPMGGTRLTVVVARGVARGPLLTGEFLPGGGDWLTVGSDNVARLDVRATLRADDGYLVSVTNTGRAAGDPSTFGRFLAGEPLTSAEIYLRSSPLFETDSPKYAWLNGIVTTAVHEVAIDHVHYRVYCLR